MSLRMCRIDGAPRLKVGACANKITIYRGTHSKYLSFADCLTASAANDARFPPLTIWDAAPLPAKVHNGRFVGAGRGFVEDSDVVERTSMAGVPTLADKSAPDTRNSPSQMLDGTFPLRIVAIESDCLLC